MTATPDDLTPITRAIRESPLNYRAYGPYWWPIKTLLIRHGELPGNLKHADPDLTQHLLDWYGRDELALIEAAHDHYAEMHRLTFQATGIGWLPTGGPHKVRDPDMHALACDR